MSGDPPDSGELSSDEMRAEIARLRRQLTQAEARIAKLEADADVDPLLGILNRRGFERELRRSLAFVQRYGGLAVLMFVDLDGFKTVNDAHGHPAGDDLLKAVAVALANQVRASDVVGRLGGDEFGVLMWNIDPAPAAVRARDIEDCIAAVSVAHGIARLSVGASAGIVALSGEATPDEMIDAADRAMYARKREKHR